MIQSQNTTMTKNKVEKWGSLLFLVTDEICDWNIILTDTIGQFVSFLLFTLPVFQLGWALFIRRVTLAD